jgi:hypothetical protein
MLRTARATGQALGMAHLVVDIDHLVVGRGDQGRALRP